MDKERLFFYTLPLFFLLIPICIGLAIVSGLLSIPLAIFFLIVLDLILAIFASSCYYKQLYKGGLADIILSSEFLDVNLQFFLYHLFTLIPFIISLKARSPTEVVILVLIATTSLVFLSFRFPVGFFTKLEPLSYSLPYKVYLARFKRIKEGNAMICGILKPRIILFSPLFEFLNEEEIKGIIAHEMGHILNRDHIKALFSLMISIIGIELIALSLYYNFVMKEERIGSLFLSAGMLLSLLSSGFLLINRRMELKADLYASHVVGKDVYISALRKLSEHDLLPLDWGSETHPSIKERIENVLKEDYSS
ncbi:MAG: M48 family metallopeptidase [Candidatus Methanodesulfokora sp.]